MSVSPAVARRLAPVLALGLVAAGTPFAIGAIDTPVAAGTFRAAAATAPAVNPAAYPYADATVNTRDPWGFSIRQCTSYAAWWLNANGVHLTANTKGPAGTAHFGNASGWSAAAVQAGWQVSMAPVVGSIAQWDAGEQSSWRTADGGTATFTAGSLGHVAVVTAVDPTTGLATLAAYNGDENYDYGVMTGVAPRYLLIGFAGATKPATSVPAPVKRSVSGVVMVYDRRGRRTGIRKVPVTARKGSAKLTATSLSGGGFRAVLISPGPWTMTAKVRGHRCGSVAIPVDTTRRAVVHIICRP